MSAVNGARWELRDESGKLLGKFVPAEELARAEGELRDAKSALERALREKAFFEKLLGQEMASRLGRITPEEIADLQANGFTAAQLREEIEKQFQGVGAKETT